MFETSDDRGSKLLIVDGDIMQIKENNLEMVVITLKVVKIIPTWTA